MSQFVQRFFILALVLILSISCKKDKQIDILFDEAFLGVIVSYPKHNLSRAQDLVFQFAEGVVQNKPIDKLLTIEPKVKGTYQWLNDHTLIFKPKEKFKNNQSYRATLALDAINPEFRNSKKEDFHFSFHINPLTAKFKDINLVSTSTYDIKNQELSGIIEFSDVLSKNELEDLINATIGGNSQKVVLQTKGLNNQYGFKVPNITRIKKDQKLHLQVNDAVVKLDQPVEDFIVPIPSIEKFELVNIDIDKNDNQLITLTFSDPINPNQNLAGLVEIKNGNELIKTDLEVAMNQVLLHPKSHITGQKTVLIKKSFQNAAGYSFKKDITESISFEELIPSLTMIDNGVIIPDQSKVPIAFETTNLHAVDVLILKIAEKNIPRFLNESSLRDQYHLRSVAEYVTHKKIVLGEKGVLSGGKNKHVIDISEIVQPEPGALYHVALGFKPEYTGYTCNEEESNIDPTKTRDMLAMEYGWVNWKNDIISEEYKNFDWKKYSIDRSWGSWDDRDNPCKVAFYNNDRIIAKNVLSSNLGLLAKRDKDQVHVFVTDLNTAAPMSGVNIQLFDKFNKLIGSAKSNGEGLAPIPCTVEPALIIANQSNQFGYLTLNSEYLQQLSKFNIGGSEEKNGLQAFIYGERGVWRPGDDIFISMMLEDKNDLLKSDHPVGFELIDPKGKIVDKKVVRNNLNSLYTFPTKTASDAMTGNYTVNAKVGGSTFTKTLKIETIQPNRLKIFMDIDKQLSNKSKPAILHSEWLHGAQTPNLKTDVQVSISDGKTTFKGFENFQFDDPYYSVETEPFTLYDGTLDQNGDANIDLSNLTIEDKAPGVLKANFNVKVFEPGGNFSIDRFTQEYYPYDKYVGIQVPNRKNKYDILETQKNHLVDIVVLNKLGNPVSNSPVSIEVFKLQWHWWWDGYDDQNFQYNGKMNIAPIQKTTITTNASGKANHNINFNDDEYGRYLIRATDGEGHTTGMIFYADWGWERGSAALGNSGAKFISIESNKEDFKVGDNVEISFPSHENNKALVTIETGNQVLSSEWINTEKGITKYTFKANEEMSPNCYVSVTTLQKHNQRNSSLPLRLYGVKNINVDGNKSKLEPLVALNSVLKPNSTNSITIDEKNDLPMTYTIAIVDEGLLDITRFKTPNPYHHFYAKRALNVETWDIFDDVMMANLSDISNYLSIGGDGNIALGENPKANRFKPVVTFLGPFYLEAGQTKKHVFDLPNYIGSVKAMVVAGHNGAYGNAETVAKVKQSLMSLTTVPRTLTPGDEVTIPVTIFAGEASIKNVDVSLQSNDLVALTTSKEQLSFSKEGEETSFFKLKVGDKLGIAKIEVHAVSGGHKSFESIEVDVRLPNPSITKTIIAELQPGQSINKAIPSFGLAGTNQLNIEVSSLPNIAFDKRLKDLIRYPYGCLEQTTSSVLPQVFMPSLFDLSEEKTNKIHVNVQAGIDKLKTFQLLNGGFAYWPGEEEVSFWGTNYAGHFLIAANQNGYQVPSQMLKDWIGFQKKEANQWVNSTDNTEIIQAYRLFLLAYAKSPLLSAMNKLRTSIKNDQGKWLLAAAYAEIGETKVAQEIMSSSAKNISKYKETHHSYGSEFRDQAMLMYVYSKLGDRLKAKPVLSDVAKKLNGDGWLSTQETSWGLMAVSAYVGNTSEQRSTMQYSYQVNSQSKVDKSIDKTLAIHSFTDKNIVIAQNNATVTNLNKYPIFVSISMEGVPSRMNVSASSSNLSMTQTYTYESGNTVNFKNIEQGKDIICKVSVTNNSSYSYLRNIALQQLLPSGFEIHNDRLDNVTDNKNLYDYQDIRDDRVNTFFSLNKNETKIFSIRLNATYAGKFYLPATKLEAMYDNTVYATTASNEIEIVKK